MSTLLPDTRPDDEAVSIRMLREKPYWRKLENVPDLLQRTLKESG